ncbi:type I glutamate--ammonia ligase [candidate division WOR-3 bacterium]|nr:type I glutamate--ammonia ligase [candidate division WOR-3 bacterium]
MQEHGTKLTPDDVLKKIHDEKIAFVDLKFIDLIGKWHHFTLPVSNVKKTLFERGVGFDGSSCPGFTSLESGDLNVVPDPETAFMDDFYEIPALSFICDIVEADTLRPFARDPRGVAKRAEKYLSESEIADESFWQPELEFYVFDSVRYSDKPYDFGFGVDSLEANWNSFEERVEPWIKHNGGYHAIFPTDSTHDLRAEITVALEKAGIPVRYHHHEVGGAGQAEIELTLSPGLVRCADNIVKGKYIIKNICLKREKSVTFMPKPIFGEPGSGLHFHQKLHKKGKNIFFSQGGYFDLSEEATFYIAGLGTHGASVMAFTNPSTNSYRRLVEGYEAPTRFFFSVANRSSAIRIPKSAVTEDQKRIEFRMPDATCNPYLAVSAMLMAGLDGIKSKISPSKFGPLDKNLFELPPREQRKFLPIPSSLEDSLESLNHDREYLFRGDVFDEDLIKIWTQIKQNNEIIPLKIRTHPFEIELYYDL